MSFETNIPIIGQTRTWKSVGMLPWKRIDPLSQLPDGSIVQERFPLGLIMTGVVATRSDDEPIMIQMPIDARTLENPERLGSLWLRAYQELASYLQCGCSRKTGPCVVHAPAATRAQEPSDAPADGVVEPGLRIVKH